MCGTAAALSLITARALLILTGAGIMAPFIFVMMNTVGFNIDHTVFVMLPWFIVATYLVILPTYIATSCGQSGHP